MAYSVFIETRDDSDENITTVDGYAINLYNHVLHNLLTGN
ncbi:hypothetical protein AHP24_45 [Escherichia phage bV_EcoS_AHP24]|uniref:Uncharacterized protein n=2 Tax=Escherichia phage vB_EcoS_AHS24 TaxID=1416030 RepID=A0A067YXR2_9CAUD|nr:hypothetical protein LA65_gp47 [Escherichia phage vB_EcoS_AHS24]AHI60513.1 hypothetical protein AHP24_45 [Escherichia phage bV_EcoS_AHP24]AHI60669.1 hypothetical protein AHS24_47 [Escherichia phage vB_EcoS_AHS24]